MDTLKKFWPRAFKANDVGALIITILIYIVADIICGFVIGILGALPLIGFLFGLLGTLVGLYFFVGIVLAVLNFLKVLK